MAPPDTILIVTETAQTRALDKTPPYDLPNTGMNEQTIESLHKHIQTGNSWLILDQEKGEAIQFFSGNDGEKLYAEGGQRLNDE